MPELISSFSALSPEKMLTRDEVICVMRFMISVEYEEIQKFIFDCDAEDGCDSCLVAVEQNLKNG